MNIPLPPFLPSFVIEWLNDTQIDTCDDMEIPDENVLILFPEEDVLVLFDDSSDLLFF